MQASSAPLLLTPDLGIQAASQAFLQSTIAPLEMPSHPTSYRDRSPRFDDDNDSVADSEPEQEAPHEDSARVRQKANWPLYRKYPLDQNHSWAKRHRHFVDGKHP